jgi:hypothetical protein
MPMNHLSDKRDKPLTIVPKSYRRFGEANKTPIIAPEKEQAFRTQSQHKSLIKGTDIKFITRGCLIVPDPLNIKITCQNIVKLSP